jgi:hypothetical protein
VLYTVREDLDNPWTVLTRNAMHETKLREWKEMGPEERVLTKMGDILEQVRSGPAGVRAPAGAGAFFGVGSRAAAGGGAGAGVGLAGRTRPPMDEHAFTAGTGASTFKSQTHLWRWLATFLPAERRAKNTIWKPSPCCNLNRS